MTMTIMSAVRSIFDADSLNNDYKDAHLFETILDQLVCVCEILLEMSVRMDSGGNVLHPFNACTHKLIAFGVVQP
jgi:hypothetical protein